MWLTATTGLSHHDYHLILGVLPTLALGPPLRRPPGSLLPLGVVLALELVNEAFDFTRCYVDGYPWGPRPMLVDIALTMASPLAIVLTARGESPDYYRFPPTSDATHRSRARRAMTVGGGGAISYSKARTSPPRDPLLPLGSPPPSPKFVLSSRNCR